MRGIPSIDSEILSMLALPGGVLLLFRRETPKDFLSIKPITFVCIIFFFFFSNIFFFKIILSPKECEGFLASIPRFCPCWRCQEAFFFYFGANRYPRHHWTVLIYRPMSTFCFVIFFDKKILWWKWFRFKVDWFPSGSRNSLCRRFPRPISEGTKRSRLADVLLFSFLFFFLLEKK